MLIENKSIFFILAKSIRPMITKPIGKHCCQIQIFICYSELNLALRAENSEQPSRCHFSIYYLLYLMQFFSTVVQKLQIPLLLCNVLTVEPFLILMAFKLVFLLSCIPMIFKLPIMSIL